MAITCSTLVARVGFLADNCADSPAGSVESKQGKQQPGVPSAPAVGDGRGGKSRAEVPLTSLARRASPPAPQLHRTESRRCAVQLAHRALGQNHDGLVCAYRPAFGAGAITPERAARRAGSLSSIRRGLRQYTGSAISRVELRTLWPMVTSATLPPPQSRRTFAGRRLVQASDPRRGARPIQVASRVVRR